MAVDDRKDFLGLLGRALALGLVGDDAGEIDGIAVDDDLAHARAGFETLDAHIFFSPWDWRILLAQSSASRHCANRSGAVHGNFLKNAQMISAPSTSWFCGPRKALASRGKRASAVPGMRWPPSLTR